MASTAAPDEVEGGGRASAVAAVAYTALLVVGVLTLGTPEGDASDATWTSHFADADSRRRVLVGGLLVVLAGIAFLLSLPGLAGRVQRRDRRTALLCAGTAHGVLVMAAGLSGASMALVKDLAGMPVPDDPDLLRISDALLFGTLLLPGLLTAGVVAWTLARSARMPGFLRVSGLVVAVLSVAGIAVLPALLWLLWFAAAALVLAAAAPPSS